MLTDNTKSTSAVPSATRARVQLTKPVQTYNTGRVSPATNATTPEQQMSELSAQLNAAPVDTRLSSAKQALSGLSREEIQSVVSDVLNGQTASPTGNIGQQDESQGNLQALMAKWNQLTGGR